MSQTVAEGLSNSWNPIDEVEEVADQNQWTHFRLSQHEIAIEQQGDWGQYQSFWGWLEESQSLCVLVCIDMEIKPEDKSKIYQLLAEINDRLWIGHFDLTIDQQPTFRHTIMMKGMTEVNHTMVEEMMNVAYAEYQRFYPVFEMVLEDGLDPDEAMAMAMVDTMGEA